jgi:hypothetical protein
VEFVLVSGPENVEVRPAFFLQRVKRRLIASNKLSVVCVLYNSLLRVRDCVTLRLPWQLLVPAGLCVICELRFEAEETVQHYKYNTAAQPDGNTTMKEAEETLYN